MTAPDQTDRGELVEALAVDVSECPDCGEKGRYEGRVLINGRGFYQCSNDHRWQDANEKPTTKGVRL